MAKKNKTSRITIGVIVVLAFMVLMVSLGGGLLRFAVAADDEYIITQYHTSSDRYFYNIAAPSGQYSVYANITGVAQSFVIDADQWIQNATMTFSRFYITAVGSPVCLIQSNLYIMTGTLGESGAPYVHLASSDILNTAGMSTESGYYQFNFSKIRLEADKFYCVSVEVISNSATDSESGLKIRVAASVNGYYYKGNTAVLGSLSGAWSPNKDMDASFVVGGNYLSPSPTPAPTGTPTVDGFWSWLLDLIEENFGFLNDYWWILVIAVVVVVLLFTGKK